MHPLRHSPISSTSPDVLLLSMPFGPLLLPSLGLSLLKAGLLRNQITAELRYFTLPFARRIGASFYSKISAGAPANHDLAGEWIFSHTIFDQSVATAEDYLDQVVRGRHPSHSKQHSNQPTVSEEFIDQLNSARDAAQDFLDECLAFVAARRPKIVGFTSVFQQHVASLSLAERIKSSLPSVFVIFGGANCEGIMGQETLQQFPFIDGVVSGEGDLVVPLLVDRLLNGVSPAGLPGVLWRGTAMGAVPVAQSVADLDSLPIPNYDDFFEQLTAAELALNAQPRILFETSRGCWWGEHHHCTFCGLNGETMQFRRKTSQRALSELSELAERYPGCPISVVDNILDMKYFQDFIPSLAQMENPPELFYEVKANLRKNQVRALRAAGIVRIQPGIESFSTVVLSLMRKGVRGIQNIQLLKWCKELGVTPEWNLLWGFPGEPAEEYERLVQLIPLLIHLKPPGGAAPIRLDRFSPNFNEADRLGLTGLAPYPAYSFVYPFTNSVVNNLAYYFTFRYKVPQDVSCYITPLTRAVREWKECHRSSDLFSVDKGTHLLIFDFRPIAETELIVLTGLEGWLYLQCDTAQSPAALLHAWENCKGEEVSLARVIDILHQLTNKHLMVREDSLFLSLAIPLGEYSPSWEILEKLLRFGQCLEQDQPSQGGQFLSNVARKPLASLG